MRSVMIALLALAGVFSHAGPAMAQRPSARAAFTPDRVTILTDGIRDPASPATRMVTDIAGRSGHGGVRILPIAGEGGLANLRDLLLLRGVDLAILDSDILAYLDVTGEYPDARRRVRYVTHLRDQTVYLLARRQFKSLDALRGRRLAASRGAMTARAIFGLERIAIDLQAVPAGRAPWQPQLGGIDGLVLLSDEIEQTGLDSQLLADFHILPLPLTPALQRAYRPARITAAELQGIERPPGNVDSLSVATLLAVFDWTPQQSRYGSVTKFIKDLYMALPALRDGAAGAPWRQVDVNAQIPGWMRHGAADPARLLAPAQLAALAVVDQPAHAALPMPAAAPTPKPLSMLVINRVPLADERAPDGGLVPALMSAGLAASSQPKGLRPSIKWSKSDPISLQLLTNETTADLLLPWDLADCDRPNDLTQALAMLCDRATFSDPIMQVVIGMFSLADSGFRFDGDASVQGRNICAPLDRDIAELTAQGRNWVAEKRITLVRQPTLIDCVGMVQRKEADAFVASDLEGRHLLQQFGIERLFAMSEKPLGTRTIHAAVWKDHPRAAEVLDTVNQAVRQLKGSGVHGSLMRQHLMSLWQGATDVR